MSALKDIRILRKMTQKQVADLMGTTEVSISRYEAQDQRLTLPLLRKFAKILDCSVAEIIGEGTSTKLWPAIRPGEPVVEIDVRAGMGGGGQRMQEWDAPGDDGGSISADKPVGTWTFPEGYLSREIKARPTDVRIIEVEGDSMEPLLRTGDRVMVDTGRRKPSPPGVFAIWDGLAIVVKRIEHIQGTDPAIVRVISDNQKHQAYERTVDEAHIIGRVVWYARRL